MAETYYFSHDYDASSDIKMMKLLRVHKSAGIGLFWRLTELLYQNDNLLHLDYETLSYDLREDIAFIKSLINDFDLFITDGDSFYSKSIQKRLNKRNEKSDKARESANKRWSKNANALQTECEGNAIKEIKIKEIKIKETKEKDIIIINNSIFSKNCIDDKQWFETISMQNKNKNIKEFIFKFDNHLIETSEQKKNIKEYKSHFTNWLRMQKTQNKSHTGNIIF